MTTNETAWAAGLYEGEGHIGFSGGRIQMRINSTDVDVLERFQQIFGVGKVYGPYKSGPRCKPIYHWACYRRANVEMVVNQILPLLGERRKRQVADVIEGNPVIGSGNRKVAV